MTHHPIQFKNVSLSFLEKSCFENVNLAIHPGSRIAIIGRNGSGKSTLLKMIHESAEPTSGTIHLPANATIGYVPQVIETDEGLSGGERLMQEIEEVLRSDPSILLLDEPTNHLDRKNRKYLFRLLQRYTGTLLIVSHDPALLEHHVDELWHLHDQKVSVFSGSYADYREAIKRERILLETKIARLDREKKSMHHALMKEQERASKKKAYGEKKYAGDTIALRSAQGRGEMTHNKNKKAIRNEKEYLIEQLSELYLPEIILPKFSLESGDVEDRVLVSVSEGSVWYEQEKPILSQIYFNLMSQERVALVGENGSGKSTLVKAFLNDPSIGKNGEWYFPSSKNIGYLDQHYNTLSSTKSVLESLAGVVTWPHEGLRRHLNEFSFRKNEEVHRLVNQLSAGEKARLSLALIAAKTPRLLILDEVTNNLDLETRQHVIDVLQKYPGAMIVISHDENFLEEIKVKKRYDVAQWKEHR